MSKNQLTNIEQKVIQKKRNKMNQKENIQGQSRRTFIGRSVAALAAATFLPSAFSCAGSAEQAPLPTSSTPAAGQVCSKFGGVQIGAITYSFRGLPGGLDNIIKYCQEANLSSIELMGSDLEASLGAPENPTMKISHRSERLNRLQNLARNLPHVCRCPSSPPSNRRRSTNTTRI